MSIHIESEGSYYQEFIMLETIFLLIVLSIVVDAIVDLLFSPASFISDFRTKALGKHKENLFIKLFSCPYCLSFWVSLIICVFMFSSIQKIFLFTLVIWRLSNFLRLKYKCLTDQSVYSHSETEIIVEERR